MQANVHFFPLRVHELFLYDAELKKAKFSFDHFISHINLKTGKHDMKVRWFFFTQYGEHAFHTSIHPLMTTWFLPTLQTYSKKHIYVKIHKQIVNVNPLWPFECSIVILEQ